MDQNVEKTNIKRKTAGSIASEILSQETQYVNPIDIARENEVEYMKTLFDILTTGKKEFINCDFYIVVDLKFETALKVVFRNMFHLNKSCPSPFYDQTVYHYVYDKDELELLWQIPDEKTCWKLYEYRQSVDPSQYELLNFVVQAHDGTLWRKMKKLNGEKYDSPLLEQ